MSDLFSDSNKLENNPFFKFDKVGDEVSGVLVARDIRPNKLKPGTDQEVYTLVKDDGSQIQVAGRMTISYHGKPTAIFGAAHSLPFGTLVGFRFDREDKPKQAGFNATKIINAYTNGTMKPEVYKEYLGVSGEENKVEGTSVEDIAF